MKTTEEIIEGNRLIAEFMGLKEVRWNGEKLLWVEKDFVEDFTNVNDYSNVSKFDWEHALPQTEELYYHSSWDWLMSVVEKIESLGFWFNIIGAESWIQNNELEFLPEIHIFEDTKIKSSWKACIEFIKWYNEANKV